MTQNLPKTRFSDALNTVSFCDDGTSQQGRATGDFSGRLSGNTRQILQQFRDQAPARWMAFLHAHFGSPIEVSAFFDVDEKTGRNWWNGVGRPTVDKTMFAQVSFPDGFRDHMLPEAVKWAAE